MPRAGDGAARPRRVAAGACATAAGPRPGGRRRRGRDRAAQLCGARHDARSAPGAAVLRADEPDGGGRAALPVFDVRRGGRPRGPGHRVQPGGVRGPRLRVAGQPSSEGRHAGPFGRARRGAGCGPAAGGDAHLVECRRGPRSAAQEARAPAADRRGLGRMHLHPDDRRPGGGAGVLRSRVRLRRDGGAGGGAAYGRARDDAGLAAGVAGDGADGLPVPVGGRQTARIFPGGIGGITGSTWSTAFPARGSRFCWARSGLHSACAAAGSSCPTWRSSISVRARRG